MSSAPDTGRIAADWLTLRRPFDERAREAAGSLLDLLAARYGASGLVDVFDLGAGTGANHAHLRDRLPFPTRWTLIDHDPELLADAGHGTGRRVLAGVDGLGRLLDEAAEAARANGTAEAARANGQLVTCSALLDLLTADELDELAATLASRGVPALFALTVTGEVRWEPVDADDAGVAAAFNAHQARSGRPGPHASAYLARACRARGAHVVVVPTPWRIETGDPGVRPFVARWVTERAAAATEQVPQDRSGAAGWVGRRLAQIEAGTARVVVGHDDLLILPAESS